MPGGINHRQIARAPIYRGVFQLAHQAGRERVRVERHTFNGRRVLVLLPHFPVAHDLTAGEGNNIHPRELGALAQAAKLFAAIFIVVIFLVCFRRSVRGEVHAAGRPRVGVARPGGSRRSGEVEGDFVAGQLAVLVRFTPQAVVGEGDLQRLNGVLRRSEADACSDLTHCRRRMPKQKHQGGGSCGWGRQSNIYFRILHTIL